MASSLGLRDKRDVETFIEKDMPGLDLVLLSTRSESTRLDMAKAKAAILTIIFLSISQMEHQSGRVAALLPVGRRRRGRQPHESGFAQAPCSVCSRNKAGTTSRCKLRRCNGNDHKEHGKLTGGFPTNPAHIQFPEIPSALRAAIVELTALDQLLYAAAEKRYAGERSVNRPRTSASSLISHVCSRLSLRETRLSGDGKAISVATEGAHVAGLNAELHNTCLRRPHHPTCIYWQQLHVGRLYELLSPSGRAPGLDLDGAPCFSYLHRAWQVMSSAA